MTPFDFKSMINPEQMAFIKQFFQVRLDFVKFYLTWSYIWDSDANFVEGEPWFTEHRGSGLSI